MQTLTTLEGDILYLPDEPAPSRAGRRLLGALPWVGLGGVGVLLVWAMVVVIGRGVRDSHKTRCANQLRQLGLALQQYEDSHRQFPAPALAGRDGTKLLSWRVAILPQLGHQALYERFHLDEPWDSAHNRLLIGEMPRVFACPGGSGQRTGKTSYLVVVGPEMDTYSVNTPFAAMRGAGLYHITDGTSNTILVMETDTSVPWTKPDDLQWTKGAPLPRVASAHEGGATIVFADGATRFIKSTIAPDTLQAILTINGGEVLSGSG
jgi:hypothetical protein